MEGGRGSKRKFKIPNVDELVLSPSQPKRLFKPSRLRSEPGEHQTESVTGKAYADYIVQQCSITEGPAVAPPLPNERVDGGGSLDDCAVTKPEIKDVPMDGSTCRGTDLLSELPGTSEVPATRGLGQNASDGPSGVIPRAVGKTNSLLVNPRQRGNPVLKYFRNVPWEFSDIVPDYVMGQTSCTLFLSLRYHHLNPDYIHERLRKLGPAYDLRVLLVQVDVKDPHRTLKELSKMCVLADCTLILAWSSQEAANYLETYKAYENKPADLLKEKTDDDYLSRVTDCLTTVKSINRTDVLTLVNTFGSLADIIKASKEDLSLCPGLGPQKAHRLNNVFLEKFERSRIPSLDGQ